jgi:signal transduction histidine kinase
MSDILTIGKIEAGKIPYAPEMHDIQLLLDEVIENNYSNLKNGRKIKVKTKGKKQDILFDRKLLGHVISNLLSNALKYSKEDPVVITHYDHENEKMRMTVEDKGIGIPQEDIKNLFQSFFRAGNVTNFSGTGLGLLIVKHFIEINKGTVSVESEENKGTKVTIELPMKN